jgi:hypothetical protein
MAAVPSHRIDLPCAARPDLKSLLDSSGAYADTRFAK